MTFEGFNDTKRLLNIDNYCKLKIGKTVNGKFLLPEERFFFTHGKTIVKVETKFKELKSNLNELKRLPPDDFRNMLPEYCDEYGKRINFS